MVSPDDFVTYYIPCNYIQLNGFSGRDEHHFLRRDNGELSRVRLNSSAELFETGTDRGHGAPLARCLSQWARCVAFGSSAPRSEERRVGTECVSTCKPRGTAGKYKK